MIRLTRLNHVPLLINSDLIEHVEVTPDTVIALTTGQKFMVSESADEVIDRVVAFRRRLLEAPAPEHREKGDRQLCPQGASAGKSTDSEGGQSSLASRRRPLEKGDRQLCPQEASAEESTVSEGGQSSLSPFSR